MGSEMCIRDRPTTGLHFEDIRKLLLVLQRLVDQGNSVFVIEHNLDVIKTADWIIDMGPEGGNGGGTVVAEGTPEQVAAVEGSYTGQYLSEILAGHEVAVGDAALVEAPADAGKRKTTARRKAKKTTSPRKKSR